jgi:hypothetical protein
MSWVHRDVRRIFEYRQSVIAELFGVRDEISRACVLLGRRECQ